jgi:hypothetical protein
MADPPPPIAASYSVRVVKPDSMKEDIGRVRAYTCVRPSRRRTNLEGRHGPKRAQSSHSSLIQRSVRCHFYPIEQRHESEQGLHGVGKADELGSD